MSVHVDKVILATLERDAPPLLCDFTDLLNTEQCRIKVYMTRPLTCSSLGDLLCKMEKHFVKPFCREI